MEEKIKELECENRHFEKELKQLYPQLETALKRQRWYNQNKCIFTKSLDDEYQELTNKILNQIKFCEETIETNFININKITSDREYLLEKIEKQKNIINLEKIIQQKGLEKIIQKKGLENKKVFYF